MNLSKSVQHFSSHEMTQHRSFCLIIHKTISLVMEKCTEHKMCISFFSPTFIQDIIHFSKYWRVTGRYACILLSCKASVKLFLWGVRGVRKSPLGASANNWSIVRALDDRWWWMWSSQWNENWQAKPKYSAKTYPSATLSTTNPTWPLTWSRTQAAKVGTRQVTAWAMAHP
jgi:hypothetical protein